MKKKDKPGLLAVVAGDLFSGYDFAGMAVQTLVDLDTVPDTAVGLETSELAEIFSAIAAPAPVESGSVEMDWDALLNDGIAPLITASSNGLVANETVEIGASVAKNIEPQGPPYREREALAALIGRTEGAVIVAKLGHKAVSLIPNDLKTAASLRSFETLDGLGTKYQDIGEDLAPSRDPAKPFGHLQFKLASLMDALDVEDSKLAKFLRSLGFTPFFAPSLANWIPKEIRRRERQATPFALPAIQDGRPLYDRMEVGLILTCTESKGDFISGTEYVVVETDALEDPEEIDKADPTKAEKAAIGLKQRGRDGGKAVYWGEMDGQMEDFFTLESDKAFSDPSNTFPERYPDLVTQAQKEIARLKLPVFDFIAADVAQLAHYKHIMFTDPPRMGKTSKTILYAEVTKTKRVALVTVANGIAVFEQELKRLGISNYVVVRKLRDLRKPARYYLMSYSWLKTCGRKKEKNADESLSPRCLCPHCGNVMMRPARVAVKDPLTGKPLLDENGVPILKLATTLKAGKKTIEWTEEYGCMCRNPVCSYTLDPKSLKEEGSEISGAAWCPDEPRVLKGYIDYELARHALCVDEKRDNFKRSRQCSTCGYVHRAWMPPRYKRLKKMFSMIAVDEIHNIKTPSSDQSQAILGMTHAKRRVGATGTLMPNNPQDAFYPTSWVFGNRNHLFSFSRGQAGVQEFNDEYTDHIVVESENSSYAKIVPFIKKPIQFWTWKASKCHFRAYTDPAVIAGMAKAGLKIPSFRPLPTELVPEPKQGLLLVASIEQFDKVFTEYSAELKAKAKANEKVYLVNSSQVLARMTQMKYAASIPGLLNDRYTALGNPSIYEGAYGGCKLQRVKEILAERTLDGGKVVIFSDIIALRDLMEKELVFYNPLHFQPKWSADKRTEAFRKFREDPDYKVFICGPRSVKESVDLSSADTVISTDLLWSPGIQMQAWSRVLTPRPQAREVQCHILLTKYSIDGHVYGTFYSKIAAAEQALYGRSLTKADKTLDIKYFVDQILAEKTSIMQWLIESGEDEMAFMPVLQTLQQLESYDSLAA
jgi:hypothetical protein